MIKRIYLQTEKDIIGGETTWCSDRINDDDEEYVRLSDLVAGGVVEVGGVAHALLPVELSRIMLKAVLPYHYNMSPGEEFERRYKDAVAAHLGRAMIGAKP